MTIYLACIKDAEAPLTHRMPIASSDFHIIREVWQLPVSGKLLVLHGLNDRHDVTTAASYMTGMMLMMLR
jgi:hypothetical protein